MSNSVTSCSGEGREESFPFLLRKSVVTFFVVSSLVKVQETLQDLGLGFCFDPSEPKSWISTSSHRISRSLISQRRTTVYLSVSSGTTVISMTNRTIPRKDRQRLHWDTHLIPETFSNDLRSFMEVKGSVHNVPRQFPRISFHYSPVEKHHSLNMRK